MPSLANINSFIEAMSFARAENENAGHERSHAFVTISREAGTGGTALAQEILSQLKREPEHPSLRGWYLFGAEMCRKVLEEAHLRFSMDMLVSEEVHSEIQDVVYQLLTRHSPQDAIFHRTFTNIRLLASVGKGVFIGRGAACLTRDLPLGIHLRLIAPASLRAARMARTWNTTETAALERVLALDRSRERMVQHYFGQDIRDPRLYDLVVNVERIEIPEIARMVVHMIKEREQRQSPFPIQCYPACSN